MRTPEVSSHTPDEVRAATEEVLRDAAYDTATQEGSFPAWIRDLVVGALRICLEWFQSTGSFLNNLRFENPVLFWLIMAALVAVLALLTWHIVYTLRRFLRSPTGDSVQTTPAAQSVRFDQLWREAERLSDDGKHTDGIRHLLLALLARVHDEKLPVPVGWTNREIASHLSRRGAVHDPMWSFMRTVDHLWYGRQDALRTDFERCRSLVISCLKTLSGGPGRES